MQNVLLVLFSLVALGGVIWPLVRKHWKQRQDLERSANWPLTDAEVVHARIVEIKRDKGASSFRVEVQLRYRVHGEAQYGAYSEVHARMELAKKMKRSFEEGPLFVRYDPANPQDYVVAPYVDVRAKSYMRPLSPEETELEGEWVAGPDGRMRDETFERIEWLIAHELERVASDARETEVLYRDPADGRYWEKSRRFGGLTEDSPPVLRRLDEARAERALRAL